MRAIKFRAWVENSFGKYMDYEPTLHVGHGMSVFINDAIKEDGNPLMQFTGLTDKNGKEIYEGDILKTDLSRPYVVVVFRNGAFMYQCHDSGKGYYDHMVTIEYEVEQDRYLEVIGNVFEDKHLLD